MDQGPLTRTVRRIVADVEAELNDLHTAEDFERVRRDVVDRIAMLPWEPTEKKAATAAA